MGNPTVKSVFLYVVQSIFFHYRTLTYKFLVTMKVKLRKKSTTLLILFIDELFHNVKLKIKGISHYLLDLTL